MATIYISDIMEQIAATVEVQGWDSSMSPPEIQFAATFVWQGVGEPSVRNWLARALTEMIVDIKSPTEEGSSVGLPLGGPDTISGLGQI